MMHPGVHQGCNSRQVRALGTTYFGAVELPLAQVVDRGSHHALQVAAAAVGHSGSGSGRGVWAGGHRWSFPSGAERIQSQRGALHRIACGRVLAHVYFR